MGWSGYGLYSGDDTATRAYDFLKWAGYKEKDDEIGDSFITLKGTILPDNVQEKLLKNIDKVLKKMPKEITDDDDAIEWQMLLALFADNKITPPLTVIQMGLEGTEYLRGQHAEDFDEPGKRKRKLTAFTKRVKKLYDIGDSPKHFWLSYDWKAGGGCEEHWIAAFEYFGLTVTRDPIQENTDTYGFFITKTKPSAKQLMAMVKDNYEGILEDMEVTDEDFLKECEDILE